MKIVTVTPLKKGIFREDLTYFTAKDIVPGDIVAIPLRNKKVLGLVIDCEEVSNAKSNIKDMQFNLRKILEVKESSIFLKTYIDSAIEISKYFVESKSNTVTHLIPAIFREKYDDIAKYVGKSKSVLSSLSSPEKSLQPEKLVFQASFEDRVASYKTMIRASFAEKKSIFIVMPTEYDVKVLQEFLSRGIEQFTFALHGGLNRKKVMSLFESIVTTAHPILILGTTPFLSIPRSDIGTVILEHESSGSYKTISKPHLDLRTFVETFASKTNTKLILSDTLLSFETISRCETDGLTAMHNLLFRTNFAEKIEVTEKSGKKFSILQEENVKKIKNTIEKNKNVFVFSLRKGLATQTVCRDCGNTVNCDKCLSPVVLYISRDGEKRIFSCNRCKKAFPSDTKCANCESWNLVPLGIGTDTVYQHLREQLGNKTRIFKLDKDSVKNSKAAEKIVKEFEENPGSILVGTEMTFFYLKEKVPLSIIASFDSLWSIPNYKIDERIMHIIFSIIAKTEKNLIIETKNDKDPAILAFKGENLLSFVREELRERKNLGYPPFKRFIKITHLGDKEQTIKARNILEEIFKDYSPEIFSGFVAKLKGKYVTNALIKLDPRKWSLSEISIGSKIDENLYTKLSSLPPQFEIFVDPEDLL